MTKITATISISKENLDCDDVLMYLFHSRVLSWGDITKNTTITKKGRIETGCRLITTTTSKKEINHIWTKLKKQYDLGCCNIKVEGKFDGCINHFLKEYTCG